MNPRRLYRSRRGRQLAGVAGGIAEYLEIDPTVVRILWILSVFLGGFTILLYIIMAFVVPLEPGATPVGEPGQAPGDAAWTAPAAAGDDRPAGRAGLYVGVLLIAFGAIAMASLAIPGLAGSGFLWAAFVVALGVALVVGATRRMALDR